MKTLVAFYSRTGNTKKAGKQIAQNLDADTDEIIDKKDRQGVIGFIVAIIDSLLNRPAEIENKKDPSGYDLVIVGTPIWTGTAAPAVKTYLSRYRLGNVAFFCTYGHSSARTFDKMEQLSKRPQAVMELQDKKIGEKNFKGDINMFCKKLEKSNS